MIEKAVRLQQAYDYLRSLGKFYTQKEFAKQIGYNPANLSSAFNGSEKYLTKGLFKSICDTYPDLFNLEYFLTGEGELLLEGSPVKPHQSNKIPLYDDVSSMGGIEKANANVEGVSEPSDYIDTGDWFKDATAAIRHYGESMVEYPPGCILAIKEVKDRRLIVPGRDYVIETSEYRVTKQVQLGNDNSYLTAYSTNSETYADGRLIHGPFDIPWDAIIRISLVLGYVVKKNGGTVVYSRTKTKYQ
jgi:hypothetical protein